MDFLRTIGYFADIEILWVALYFLLIVGSGCKYDRQDIPVNSWDNADISDRPATNSKTDSSGRGNWDSARQVNDSGLDSSKFEGSTLEACLSGYQEVDGSCVDVDECRLEGVCRELRPCRNLDGGYECGACPDGYEDVDGHCQDVDECEDDSACPELKPCNNLDGGYECGACPDGYKDVDGHCQDVDECEDDSACPELKPCNNLEGSYECGACSDGYEDVDGHCQDVDECAQDGVCPALRECLNEPGGFKCGSCPTGYDLAGVDCIDVDECATTNTCDPLAFCDNQPGSYTCRCPAYYSDDNEGRECLDTRLTWLFTAPVYGFQALPFGSDLLLAGTIQSGITIDGVTVTTAGGLDIFLARLDGERKVQWLQRFGGKNNDHVFWSELDTTGDLVVTGITYGGLDIGDGPIDAGDDPVRYVAKFNSTDGSLLWSHILHNTDIDGDAWEGFISSDNSLDVLVCGRFLGPTVIDDQTLVSAGNWDMFVAKFSADGELRWARNWGSSGNEQCRAVMADVEGNIFVAGIFDQVIEFGTSTLFTQGLTDVFLAKLDANGNTIWSRRMGGPSRDEIGRMAVDGAGNAIVAGSFATSASFGGEILLAQEWDAWIAKWSSAGDAVWSRQIGGPATDLIWGVTSGPSNDIAVAGLFQEIADFGEGVRVGAGSADAFVAKYSADGILKWSRDFGAAGWDTAAGIKMDAQGNVFVTGWYSAPADLGAGPTTESGGYLLQFAP